MKTFDESQIRDLSLFDANCQLGPSDWTVCDAPTSVAQLTAEMDRCGIREALVHHSFASGYHPGIGNDTLAAEISGVPRLRASWVVLPHHTGEMQPPTVLIYRTLAAGARAVRVFPARHRFLLSDWTTNELLSELSEHQLPLLIDYDRTHWTENIVDYSSVYRICKEFPFLPLILVREGIGSARYLYPLLEKCDNLHIETSYYQLAGGLEDISKKFGAKHLLFGTGLPNYEAGPAISMLLHSDLSLAEKRMIAGDNVRALLKAVRLEEAS
jgi:predicted TIM-barrel fold metal-dependent hydrolase